jgi:hypothetical protein
VLAVPDYHLELALKMLSRAHTRATLQLRMMELFTPKRRNCKMRTSILAFAFASGLVLATGLPQSPAWAFQCPALMAEIDAALPAAEISEEERQRVVELRELGEQEHEAGNHDASEAALNEARGILGIM